MHVQSMSESQMRRILALNWKNPHSTRLQRAIGCNTLVCAWRADIGRWLLANVERVRVGKSFGMRTYEEYEDVPVVWKVWQDDDGSFLDITDPQLVPYIRKCDGTTGGSERMLAAVAADDARKDAEIKAIAAETADGLVDRIKWFRQKADEGGLVAHRKGGHEGGKISSASLWRDYSASPRIVLA